MKIWKFQLKKNISCLDNVGTLEWDKHFATTW